MNANGVIGTSTQVNPLFAYSGAQPYYALLIISDSLIRSCTDSFELPITFTTAVSETAETAGDMFVFPNPNNGSSFNVQLPQGFDVSTTQVKVFDMVGREVEVKQTERRLNGLKLTMGEHCVSGVYSLMVSNFSKILCCKLVIVK
jgi:hypothetical protein